MTESPNQSDLEIKLLRAEQNYFDQAKNLSNDHKKSIKMLEDKIKERDKDIAFLRIQVQQAQEELGYSINQVSTLEDWTLLASQSLKYQIKLMIRELIRRGTNRSRWLVPLQSARRLKKLLLHFNIYR